MNELPIEQRLPPELRKEYEALKQTFLKKIAEKAPLIRKSFNNFISNNAEESLNEFYKEIHRLTGSAGMYGCNDLSLVCYEMSNLLKPVLKDLSVMNELQTNLIADKYKCLDEILKVYERIDNK